MSRPDFPLSDEPVFKVYDYTHAPTLKRFALSNKKIRVIKGPFGSGKSSACGVELVRKAQEQAPNRQGVRRTRFAIVRNTYREIQDTCMKTFFEWFPHELLGTYNKEDQIYTIKRPLPDGTYMKAEFYFRSLDQPKDVEKLLSVEYTGAWFNELREIDREIFDTMDGRVGRFPPKSEEGCTWRGVIADTNPSHTQHWIYDLFKREMYADAKMGTKYELFEQPSGLSPEAENIPNLEAGYYENLAIGKSDEFIKVYIKGEWGYVQEGRPVYEHFIDSLHVSKERLEPIPRVPIILGFDAGLDPAFVICQFTQHGRFLVLKEMPFTNTPMRDPLITVVKPVLMAQFFGFPLIITGDIPRRTEADGLTTYQMIKEILRVDPIMPFSNRIGPRIDAVDTLLRQAWGKERSFIMSPDCVVLRSGFNGGYHRKKIHQIGSSSLAEEPAKTRESHIHDGLQYASMYVTNSCMRKPEPRYQDERIRQYVPVAAWS